MSTYEFWLCDDNGRRITLLKNIAYFSYTRTTRGFGTILLGVPLEAVMEDLGNDYWRVDWRIDVWRSPADNYPLRRECSFLLRKSNIYQRIGDSMVILEYFGRSPIDLLRRDVYRSTTTAITGSIDDIMKTIVAALIAASGAFYDIFSSSPYPDFLIEANESEGPSITYETNNKIILDCLQELQNISLQKNLALSTSKKIYFDLIEIGISGRPTTDFGYEFITFPDMRGQDRTNGQVFSVENGNITKPNYNEDHLDESNYVELISPDGAHYANNPTDDATLSRWNRIALWKTTSIDSADLSSLDSEQKRVERENSARKNFSCVFVNSPGSNVQPRSLYGIDWNLGDLLPVQFAGKSITAEVVIVYVNVDENGKEEVTGRTEVGA